ncbi:MAG: 16S rRNA (adenine(1518)-N(6)/adenine(1519)-N(6))-dimethyltransferase RsmA [Actinomycetota bacterium]|jgi:16S rRNA (adenine1518-N6/adenine1519-N6)-dimethyltransferase
MTLSRRDISDLLTQHGLAPRREFGQNFVADPNTVRRIARLAKLSPTDHVVEIGAGLGSLTTALAETGAAVTAIEIDHGIVPVLRSVVAELERVTIVEGDAQELPWHQLLAASTQWVLVANLPYNVGTPLVLDLLDTVPEIARMLVMVQREVAERIVASPRTSAYGAITVKVAYWATARIVGYVPSTVFVPQPKVESALVEITRRPKPAVADIDPTALFALVKAGFAHRRKMLRGTLGALVTPEQFEQAGIAPTARAEELDVHAWGRLAIITEAAKK